MVTIILGEIDSGRWEQRASRMAEIELSASTDEIRRRRVLLLLPRDRIELTPDVFDRARQVVKRGLHAADAVHVAAAEAAGADVFLTCDDRLLRQCRRIAGELNVVVANPVDWLREQNDASNIG